MEDSSGLLISMFFLILLSGVFSGSESALLSLEDATLRTMKEKKMRGVGLLIKLKQNPKRLIITILLGNNIVNVLLPVLATIWGTAQFGDAAIGIVTGGLTFILLLFGEILPKNFAISHNQKFSLVVAPFIYFLSKALLPFVWIFEKISEQVTPNTEKGGITEAEVLAMVSMSEEHGDITTEEKNRIENLLEFSDTTAAEIMTPRTKILGLEDTNTLGESRNFFLENPHSRIPVYTEDLDHIKEIITLRDILESMEENTDEKLIKNLDLRSPYFVPITKNISHLFQDFQKQRTHIAIVLDEHGGTAGLVTMEDIFEEIFGEIQDETDREEAEIKKIDNTSWRVSPRMTVSEVFEETCVQISNYDADEEKNLSLLILEKLGRFPRRGETISFENADIIVERMGEKSVESLRVVQH